MSDMVRIEAGGLIALTWDSKIQIHRRRRVSKSTVLAGLRLPCVIKKGTTLRDVFRVVESYKRLKAVISQYAWCRHIDAFHAKAEGPPQSLDRAEMFGFLEVYGYGSLSSWAGKGEPTTISLEKNVGFHIQDHAGDVSYSILGVDVSEIANLIVRFKEKYTFDLRLEEVNGRRQTRLETESSYTLLEALSAIYFEISFCGSSADNAKFREEAD